MATKIFRRSKGGQKNGITIYYLEMKRSAFLGGLSTGLKNPSGNIYIVFNFVFSFLYFYK